MINSNQNYHPMGGNHLGLAVVPSNVNIVPYDNVSMTFNKTYLDPTFLQGAYNLASNLIDEIHHANKNFNGIRKCVKRLKCLFIANVLYVIFVFIIFFLGGFTMNYYFFFLGGALILKMFIINIIVFNRNRSKMLRAIPKIETKTCSVINNFNISLAPLGIRAQFRRDMSDPHVNHHHHHHHGHNRSHYYNTMLMFIDFYKIGPQGQYPGPQANIPVGNPIQVNAQALPNPLPNNPNINPDISNYGNYQPVPNNQGLGGPAQNQFNYNNYYQNDQNPRYG